MLCKPEREEEKKKSHYFSSCHCSLFLLDRSGTAVAAIGEKAVFMVDSLRYSGKNYALPKVWTVLVSDNVIFTLDFLS